MTATQKLQEIADRRFGRDFLEIKFERFDGFYAYPGRNCPPEMQIGYSFLGREQEAREKIERKDLS